MASTLYYGSRAKAAIGLAGCVAFVVLGYWLTGLPSIKAIAVGWLSLVFFGAISPFWLSAIFRPNRLIIDNNGFSVRQPLLGTRSYRWSDIAMIFVDKRTMANLVVWQLRNRPAKLAKLKATMGQPNDYDGYLPAGWRVPATEIAAQMEQAHSKFLHGQRTGNGG